jgi:hypothetical protein
MKLSPILLGLALAAGCGGGDTAPLDTPDAAVPGPDAATGCPTVLAPVECMHPLRSNLVLDGQVMTCTGDLAIEATLRLINGSRLASSGRFFIQNGGVLLGEGTADCKVGITSARTSPAAGDWSTMRFASSGGAGSMLTHTVVEYGGDNTAAITLLGGGEVGFDHVTVRHTLRGALDLAGGRVTRFRAVAFEHVAGSPVRIHPDHAAVVEPDIAIDAATVDDPFVDVVASPRIEMSLDGTWEDIGVPYRLFGDIRFEADLTLEAGARVWIAPAQRFFVTDGGTLRALGTAAAPVEIRSANPTGQPGDWKQFTLDQTAGNSSLLRHTTVAHGGADGHGALNVGSNARIALENVTFVDNASCDVRDSGAVTVTETSYAACD